MNEYFIKFSHGAWSVLKRLQNGPELVVANCTDFGQCLMVIAAETGRPVLLPVTLG